MAITVQQVLRVQYAELFLLPLLYFPAWVLDFLGYHYSIPGWLCGIVYTAFSIYGIKSKKDNILAAGILTIC